MISAKRRKLVTLKGECFDVEYHGDILGTRDGVFHDFQLYDAVKNRGVLRLAVTRGGARDFYTPTWAEYDRREDAVVLKVIRQTFDSGMLNFDAKAGPSTRQEIALEPSDFANKQPATSDKVVRSYIIHKAYWLAYRYPIKPPIDDVSFPIPFDEPADLEYLNVTRSDVWRNIKRLENKGLLSHVRQGCATPTESLLTQYEEEDESDLPSKPAPPKPSSKSAESHNSDPDKNDDSPSAFISYSWDSEAHKQWVLDLASRLQTQGVRVILDQWNLAPGGDRTFFMEDSVFKSKFVVLVCTPPYAKRANNREGGVGYEATIITGELAKNIKQAKFIPVLRDGDWDSSLPRWIQTKLGVDLRGNPYSESQYEDLLRALHEEPLKPPPLGPKPLLEQNQSAPKTQRVSSPVPLKFSSFGGTPGPILFSGSEHSSLGPQMILSGLVTIVNCALVPVEITPIRLLIDGKEWSVHRIFFKRAGKLNKLERVYLAGNRQEDFELHFMFPDDHYPQSLSGELLIHINENEPLSVPVMFP